MPLTPLCRDHLVGGCDRQQGGPCAGGKYYDKSLPSYAGTILLTVTIVGGMVHAFGESIKVYY